MAVDSLLVIMCVMRFQWGVYYSGMLVSFDNPFKAKFYLICQRYK